MLETQTKFDKHLHAYCVQSNVPGLTQNAHQRSHLIREQRSDCLMNSG